MPSTKPLGALQAAAGTKPLKPPKPPEQLEKEKKIGFIVGAILLALGAVFLIFAGAFMANPIMMALGGACLIGSAVSIAFAAKADDAYRAILEKKGS